MTEKELKQYTGKIKEIHDLNRRIEKSYDKEITVVAGKVKGSSSHFPYIEIRTSVEMEDPVEVEDRDKLIRVRENKILELQKEALQIETFINDIQDSNLRLMFKYRFIDGLKQREVSNIVGLERSGVSKKINDYLKLSHKSQ